MTATRYTDGGPEGWMQSPTGEFVKYEDYQSVVTALCASLKEPDRNELDAERWRALVRSTGHETDMSSGPGTHKDMHIRFNCTGCERYTESGAPDWKATLEAVMDSEIQLQRRQSLSHSAGPKP